MSTILRREESIEIGIEKIVVVAWAVLDLDIRPAMEELPDYKYVEDIKEVVKMYAKKFVAELKPNDSWDILIS